MLNMNQYKVEDYTFIYDDVLDNDFNKLGYFKEDLKQLGEDLVAYFNNTPPKFKGDFIKESGGAVKVRISKNRSTRGSEDRLIYTTVSQKIIILMRIYTKSRQKNLSKKEIKEISKLISQYKKAFTSIAGAGLVVKPLRLPILIDTFELMDEPIFMNTFEFVDEPIVLE